MKKIIILGAALGLFICIFGMVRINLQAGKKYQDIHSERNSVTVNGITYEAKKSRLCDIAVLVERFDLYDVITNYYDPVLDEEVGGQKILLAEVDVINNGTEQVKLDTDDSFYALVSGNYENGLDIFSWSVSPLAEKAYTLEAGETGQLYLFTTIIGNYVSDFSIEALTEREYALVMDETGEDKHTRYYLQLPKPEYTAATEGQLAAFEEAGRKALEENNGDTADNEVQDETAAAPSDVPADTEDFVGMGTPFYADGVEYTVQEAFLMENAGELPADLMQADDWIDGTIVTKKTLEGDWKHVYHLCVSMDIVNRSGKERLINRGETLCFYYGSNTDNVNGDYSPYVKCGTAAHDASMDEELDYGQYCLKPDESIRLTVCFLYRGNKSLEEEGATELYLYFPRNRKAGMKLDRLERR